MSLHRVSHGHAFGDLYREVARIQGRFIQDRGDALEQVRDTKLRRRQIDRHRHSLEPRFQPAHDLATRLAEHPLANRHDQSGLFGDSDERRRGDKASGWVLPTNQVFGW